MSEEEKHQYDDKAATSESAAPLVVEGEKPDSPVVEAKEEEQPSPPVVEGAETKTPPVDDHPLVASVGSGDDDYESAGEETDQKPTTDEPGQDAENPENVAQNGESGAKTVGKDLENDDAASTSSDGSEAHAPGRRRRGEESDEHEEHAVHHDAEKVDRSERDEDEFKPERVTERESGDGEELPPPPPNRVEEEPEDRKNPAFVPRRGNFFQHDTRAADEPEKPAGKQSKKQIMMEKQSRWHHDMFDETEQMPKSRHELINSYGYDIRHESRAPRDPHGRRYGRSQNMERDWRDPESYGRRSFGGYRRSFGAGGGRGRGRGGGRRDQQEPTSQGSRSVSPGLKDTGQMENKRSTDGYNKSSVRRIGRSRSFSDGERPPEDSRPYNTNRGSYRGGHQRTFGTVEFRRRGRGTAFTSNQKGSGGGAARNYDSGQQIPQRSAEGDFDRSVYNENARGGRHQFDSTASKQRQSYQASPRFQQHQGPRRGAPYSASASSRRSRESEQNESSDSTLSGQLSEVQQQQRQSFQTARQQTRNQERANVGASTKRYSAIRQQTHPQQNFGPPAPTSSPQPHMSNSVQQGDAMPTIPLIMPQGPQANAAPIAMMAPPPGMEQPSPYPQSVPFPPYYNGSSMYQRPAPVPVPEIYPVAGTYADGSSSYVLPAAAGPPPPPLPHGQVQAQAFIGQRQYPPGTYGMNQPIPHYSAETRDAYAAAGSGAGAGAGGTVYFDPGSQQHRPQRYAAPETKRRPKSIPIVSPEQAAATTARNERTSTGAAAN